MSGVGNTRKRKLLSEETLENMKVVPSRLKGGENWTIYRTGTTRWARFFFFFGKFYSRHS